MRIKRWLSAILALALISALAACGGGGDDDDDSGATSDANATPYNVDVGAANKVEEMTYDVEYDDDALVVEEDAVEDDLVSVSEDGNTVRLQAGSETAENMKLGDVVLFAGKTFGKVDSIDEDGDEVVVTLGDATLNQVIKDGEFSWKDEINWSELSVATLSEGFERTGLVSLQTTPEPTLPKPEGLKFSGNIQGWDVEFELKPTAERLNMNLTAKYGAVVAVTGVGFISNFTEETFVKFEDSKFGEAAVRTTELETEMELTWHAFDRNDGAGLTEVAKFSLPVAFDIPFLIGPIPFQFSIKAVLQVVPAFEGEASSGGSWKVNYKSSQGFKVDNTLGGAIGQMTGASIGTSNKAETVTSGLGPAGFAIGVEFPRFELGIFGSTAVAFVTLKTYSAGLWTPGTTLTADIPPCQMGFTEVSAQYGYALKLLGFVGVEAQSDIWKHRINKFLDKPCSLDGGAAPQDTLTQGPGDSEIRPEPDDDEPTDEPSETPEDSGDADDQDPDAT